MKAVCAIGRDHGTCIKKGCATEVACPQESWQFLFNASFEIERVQAGREGFELVELLGSELATVFEPFKGVFWACRKPAFAATFDLGAQVLHHWGKEIAEPTPCSTSANAIRPTSAAIINVRRALTRIGDTIAG